MIREEAIEQLKWYFEYDNGLSADKETVEAYRMAVKALEQEPCDDAISRQAAINVAVDAVDDWDGGCNKTREEYIRKALETIPPVTPKPRTGHWIRITDKTGHFLTWQCDKCGLQHKFSTDYCPDCGHKMEVVEDG